jgi:hypothetical protein
MLGFGLLEGHLGCRKEFLTTGAILGERNDGKGGRDRLAFAVVVENV